MAGRKPLGPALVEHLDGSPLAKERLELILATNAGQITVVEAARQLGISEARFYKLRTPRCVLAYLLRSYRQQFQAKHRYDDRIVAPRSRLVREDSMNAPRSYAVALLFAGMIVTLAACSTLAAEPADVVFKSKLDGTDQRYVVLLPDVFDPKKPHSVLIALHGHGSDRWQFVNDKRDECRAARDVAAKHKLIYVSPDYRAKTSWMGPAAEADVVQILAELRAKYRVNKVIVSGGSMGGTAALTFASLHPELVDGVVSMNGTANLVEYEQFQDSIAASFGGSKTEKPDEYKKRSAELHLDKLTMPIACTTGGKDRAVPPDSVLRMAEGLKAKERPVKLIHRPDGGHSTNYADATEAFELIITEVVKAK